MTASQVSPRGSAPARARARTAGRAWTAVCAAAFVLLCLLLGRFVTDDAWISVRYAENVASGGGFAFNPGGPRVEGFSNPGLVSLEALGVALGIPAVTTARALGVASGVALLVLLHIAAPPVVGRRATRIAIAFTALFPPMALWAVGGLETLPAALATTAGVLALARPAPALRHALLAGSAFTVLPWLRPEGLVIALAVAVAAEALTLLRGPDRRPAAARLGLAAGLPLLSQAALEALRLGVWDHLLPNSVYYKSATGETFEVLTGFLRLGAPVLAAAAAGLLLARGRARLLAVAPLVYAAGSIGMMDSVNSFSRFFLPTWPLWALLAAVAIAAAGRRTPVLAGALAVALAALLFPRVGADTVRFASDYASCKQAVREDAAAWLRTRTPPGAAFSISDAGLVPARAQRPAVDQMMLNEPELQRLHPVSVGRKVDHVYDSRPHVLVLAGREPGRFTPRYEVDAAIARDRRFAGYSLAHVAGADCGYTLFAFRQSRTTR